MARTCEVCDALEQGERPPRPPGSQLRRVSLDGRIVALCERHAAIVRERRPRTLTDLRTLFPEQYGRRSLVDRRAPLDRRVFPPRPEGRRAIAGRREAD